MTVTIKKMLAICFSFILTNICAQQTTLWGDQGDGTYRNPVLPGDYSDIDAIRVGDDYYAVSSTFQYSPGVVIIHSKDLVNWKILSHVIDDVTVMGADFNWDKMNRYGRGVWAGSLRYYKDKYWVYFGTPDEGFFMSSATDPAGPWEPLHELWSVRGWDDCCSFYDDDGQIYFIATHFADGYKSYIFKLSEDGKSILTEEGKTIEESGVLLAHMQSKGREASKLYKINSLYYQFYSEVEGGRYMMMGRSDNIYGPYETKQINRVNVPGLEDREPNQGGLIELPDNTWWFFTHHGNGRWDGRCASLLPVTWIDGWPIVGTVGNDGTGYMAWTGTNPLPVDKSFFIQTNDEFNDSKPAVQWEWNYQPRADMWSLSERPGFLRLKAFQPVSSNRGILFRVGNTITQRSMKTEYCTAVAKVHIDNMADGQVAGICHYGSTYSTFGIKQVDGVRYIYYDNNGTESFGPEINGSIIYLRSAWGFDGVNQYSYNLKNDDDFVSFGNKYGLSWGNYRGDRIGIFTYNETGEKGYIDVDWFHYDYNGEDPGIETVDPGTENLTHQWLFDDGTANDSKGTAHGILKGNSLVENGVLSLKKKRKLSGTSGSGVEVEYL